LTKLGTLGDLDDFINLPIFVLIGSRIFFCERPKMANSHSYVELPLTQCNALPRLRVTIEEKTRCFKTRCEGHTSNI
jgi:hypothetical protein